MPHAASVFSISWDGEMEWTEGKVTNLIDLYRDRPILWDCRLRDYRDRNKKMDALMEIAVIVGVEKEEVERKIKNLVCHYLRETKRERDSINSGAGSDDVYKSKWFCYSRMLFLRERNQPRGMSTNTHMQEDLTHSTNEILKDDANEMEYSMSPPTKIFRKTESLEERLTCSATSYLRNNDDDYHIMVKSYLAKLKKLSPQQLLFADRVIHETLLDAQLGKLTRWTTLSHDDRYPPAPLGSDTYYNNYNAAPTSPGTPSSAEQFSGAFSYEEEDSKSLISHII